MATSWQVSKFKNEAFFHCCVQSTVMSLLARCSVMCSILVAVVCIMPNIPLYYDAA